MYVNNDNTKRSAVADLILPADPNAPFIATRRVSAVATMNADDQVLLCDATTAGFAVTPPVTAVNKLFTVKKTDASANTVTVAGLDGATTTLSVQGAAVSFVSDGAAFNIISKV